MHAILGATLIPEFMQLAIYIHHTYNHTAILYYVDVIMYCSCSLMCHIEDTQLKHISIATHLF